MRSFLIIKPEGVAGDGEGQVPAEEPADRGGELHPEPVGRVGGVHLRWTPTIGQFFAVS